MRYTHGRRPTLLHLPGRWPGLLLACCLLAFPLKPAAMQAVVVDVQHQGSTYTIDMDLQVMASPKAVFNVLSDYARLHRLSENIRESVLLVSYNDHHHRIRTITSACILFFCNVLIQVQDINEIEGREIRAVALAQASNVKHATVHWRIAPEAQHTRLKVRAQITPKFWVPPLIGPWFIKQSLRGGMMEMVENIEYYARAQP